MLHGNSLRATWEQPLCCMGTATVPHGNSHCTAWEQPLCCMGTCCMGTVTCCMGTATAWEQPLCCMGTCAAWEQTPAAWEQTPAAWEQPPCCMGTATMLHGNSHHATREQPPCCMGTATVQQPPCCLLNGNPTCLHVNHTHNYIYTQCNTQLQSENNGITLHSTGIRHSDNSSTTPNRKICL